MRDARSGPNPLSPDSLSTDEHLSEAGRILVAKIGRVHPQKSSSWSAASADNLLRILALKSGGDLREPRDQIRGDDARSNEKIDAGLGSQNKNAFAVNVLTRLTALKEMTLNELKAKWGTIFATPARDNSRGYLALRIGHRIQELIHGALSWETWRTLDLLSDATKNKY